MPSESSSRPVPRDTARLHGAWWAPQLFVVLTLVVLAVVPVLVSRHVRRMRQRVTEVTDPSRVLVNDVQLDLATELLARAEVAGGRGTAGRARYARALRDEERKEEALDSLARGFAPGGVERLIQYRTLVSRWHAALGAREQAGGARGARGADDVTVLTDAVLASATRLDEWLDDQALAQRRQVQELERADVLLPAALAPLALGSAAVVFWLGHRILRLAEEAERGRAALAAAATARAGLMRGVTHDLRNPLSAAIGYVELLADGTVGELAPEQHTMIGRLRRLLLLANDTVSDLLHLSVAESGQLALRRVPADAARLARDAVADYEAVAARQALAIAAEGVATAPVTTDPVRVRQILGNLLSNAMKYTPAGGRVTVRVEPAAAPGGTAAGAAGVTIRVQDTGPGIPPEHRARLFEEFFRLPEHRARGIPGTGVGLAVSRRLARAMGGELALDDAAGVGATFVLWLPEAPPE